MAGDFTVAILLQRARFAFTESLEADVKWRAQMLMGLGVDY